MTIDEKLDNFYNATMEDATNQNVAIIEEYTKSLKEIYEEHKRNAIRKANIALDIESQNCIREKNKALSTQNLDNRRIISIKTEELTNILFSNISIKLDEFMKTPDYIDLLEKQINMASAFSKQEPVTIYINPPDADKISDLEKKTGVTLTISSFDFLGGTRALIQTKNVLIDNSFATKLKEEREKFTL